MRRPAAVIGIAAARWAIGVAMCALLGTTSPPVLAADSVCARVQIEIVQEATLERQAFDAHMRISNGLPQTALEQVGVAVVFTDAEGEPVAATSDPDNTTALFFIRVDSLSGIDHVDGSGMVVANSTADIHWLIVPAPGASNGLDAGTLYYVGATLTYTMGGRETTVEVTPDWITVKPMPEMTLDYFLPAEVYGDDAFTPDIEPPVPFSLGLRVANQGHGTAWDLKIDSAQPRIVDNDQGLLVSFVIEGSEANGAAVTPSLRVALGDVRPSAAATARWVMSCSLSGRFTDFSADCSHADELGGELTSLIAAANAHTLVRDVLVDLPGRDGIRDFLAEDSGLYRVYESDATDSPVLDQSSGSTLTDLGSGRYSLTTPVTAGFLFVQLPDPSNGGMVLREAVRSDGKRLKTDNAWLTKTRVHADPWQYFVCLFDANTPGSYTLTFESGGNQPQPPVLQFIPDQTAGEGQPISFVVLASDPNGTTPSLSAAPLPTGATFTDQGDGIGAFDWTPSVGQAGTYQVTFTASDGVLTDSQVVRLAVFPDSDGDGLDDDWERLHFGDLGQGPSSDYDGDTETNLTEFGNGTDPTDARSTADPANAYSAFHFEIWRSAEQSPGGGFTTDQWGVSLACLPKTGEGFVTGAMTKPDGTAGASPVALGVPADGTQASYAKEDYAAEADLLSDLVAGTYRVALEADRGGGSVYTLRFLIAVPAYTAADFPDYVLVESPAPGVIGVSTGPLLDFGTGTWDWLEIRDATSLTRVYAHSHDDSDVPADTHQVPAGELANGTEYTLRVDTNAFDGSWLGSISRSPFTTRLVQGVAPTGVDLLAASDSGALSTDDVTSLNNSAAHVRLSFDVSGTVPGATVQLYADGTPIGSAVAADMTTPVETDGTTTLADGAWSIAATQTEPAKSESDLSPALTVTIDTTPPALVSALSRKRHGAAGTFDLVLPVEAPWGIECRMAAITTATLVFGFNEAVAAGPGFAATVTDGTATLGAADVSWATLTLDLDGVTDIQWLTLRLGPIEDVAGNVLDLAYTLGILAGDVTQNGQVNAQDILFVRYGSLQSLDEGTNFVYDLNASGAINAQDVLFVRYYSLHALPAR